MHLLEPYWAWISGHPEHLTSLIHRHLYENSWTDRLSPDHASPNHWHLRCHSDQAVGKTGAIDVLSAQLRNSREIEGSASAQTGPEFLAGHIFR